MIISIEVDPTYINQDMLYLFISSNVSRKQKVKEEQEKGQEGERIWGQP